MKKEQLYQKIKDKMPQNLSELEKSAYIMMVIAQNKEFSSQYYWSDKATRRKMYNKAINKEKIKLQNKRELICVTACRLYKDIAERLGLNVYYTGDSGKLTKNDLTVFKNGEHLSPVVKLKDGRFIKTDVEWDLENIQTGSKWLRFGTRTPDDICLSEISQDEIDNIMMKIGYINSKQDYTDVYYDKLCEKMDGLDNKEKLEKIFSDEYINDKVEKFTGSVEIFRFYRNLIKKATMKNVDGKKTNDYNKNIFIFGAYVKNKKSNARQYTVCVYLKDLEQKILPNTWIYSKKKKRMVNISGKELKYFMQEDKLKFVKAKTGSNYYEFLGKIMKNQKQKDENNIREMVI